MPQIIVNEPFQDTYDIPEITDLVFQINLQPLQRRVFNLFRPRNIGQDSSVKLWWSNQPSGYYLKYPQGGTYFTVIERINTFVGIQDIQSTQINDLPPRVRMLYLPAGTYYMIIENREGITNPIRFEEQITQLTT